jgi:exonuclease III
MKLISINIEGDKHFSRVLPFVDHESPDVLCVQEIFRKDLRQFEVLGYQTAFLPITRKEYHGQREEIGNAFVVNHTRAVLTQTASHYYHNPTGEIHDFDKSQWERTVNNGVLVGTINLEHTLFTIATTQFTWIPDGNIPTESQRNDMVRFLAYMNTHPQHCIVGDLNIPRNHNPLYDVLCEQYEDAVPSSYTSSLDLTFHRLGVDPEKKHLFTDYMVDYILTQSPYSATDVRLEFGISDHAAVVGEISLN